MALQSLVNQYATRTGMLCSATKFENKFILVTLGVNLTPKSALKISKYS